MQKPGICHVMNDAMSQIVRVNTGVQFRPRMHNNSSHFRHMDARWTGTSGLLKGGDNEVSAPWLQLDIWQDHHISH